MTTIAPICFACKHFEERPRQGEGNRWYYTCAAFPEGIAEEVLLGVNLHTKPIAGDHGLQYEAKATLPPEVQQAPPAVG